MRRLRLLCLALLTALSLPATAADSSDDIYRAEMAKFVTSAPGFTMPSYRDELDRAYARRDGQAYASLVAKHVSTLETLQQQANWERYTVYTGGGAWVRYLYPMRLWGLAKNLDEFAEKQPQDAKTLREQSLDTRKLAVTHTLYAMAAAHVDGRRCVKPSDAPYFSVLLQQRDILIWSSRLTPAEREPLIDYAMQLEQAQARLRAVDSRLCASRTQFLALKDEPRGNAATSVPTATDDKEALRDKLNLLIEGGAPVEPRLEGELLPPDKWPAAIASGRGTLRDMLVKAFAPAAPGLDSPDAFSISTGARKPASAAPANQGEQK